MRETILEQLKQIEIDNNCKILFAIESGSRAWGFESTDSDYDVRFVYVKQPDTYLQLDDERDVIEVPISNDLDINGWDIKKALKLFRKSNPPLLEWLNSDIIYMDDDKFRNELRDLTGRIFSLNAGIKHYLNMANNNFREYLKDDQVRVKKYFYVLRPIFACQWIITNQTVPPIKFDEVMANIFIPRDIRDEIDALLVRKRGGVELGLEPRNELLNDYIEEQLATLDVTVKGLSPADINDPTPLLNDVFRRYRQRAWL